MAEDFEGWLREELPRAASELEERTRPASTVLADIEGDLKRRRLRRAVALVARLGVVALAAVLVFQLRTEGPSDVTILTTGQPPAQDARRPAVLKQSPLIQAGQSTASPAESPSPEGSLSPTASPVSCPQPQIAMTPPEGISVTLELSKTLLSRDEPTAMTLRVRNSGLTPVTYWRGSKEYDFWVEGPDGVVWLWGADKIFTDILFRGTIAPAEERVRTEVFEQKTCTGADGTRTSLLPGRYAARALWLVHDRDARRTGGWWSNPVAFEIR